MKTKIQAFTEKFESVVVTMLLAMLMAVVLPGALGLLVLIVRTLIERS